MFLFDGHHQLTVVFYKICIAETPTHNVFLQPFTTDIVPREDRGEEWQCNTNLQNPHLCTYNYAKTII